MELVLAPPIHVPFEMMLDSVSSTSKDLGGQFGAWPPDPRNISLPSMARDGSDSDDVEHDRPNAAMIRNELTTS